jgi:ABC-type multidrug transport system ATPase subunit
MSESILKALMQLFALISDIHDDTVITSREKDVVRLFLARHLNNELVSRYMKMFEGFLDQFNDERITKGSIQDKKRISVHAMRILEICEKINEELQQKQKVYTLVKLIDYISSGEEVTENELDFLQTVANAFYISDTEYQSIRHFILEKRESVPEKNRVLIINNLKESDHYGIKHICSDNLNGTICFLHIPSTNTYILRYYGSADLYLNGQIISSGETYAFDHGSSVRGQGINPIYYSEVVSIISGASLEIKIELHARDVSFKFRNSDNGIHNLDFHEESGKLVGILGGSGVGKSTTLSILNGTLEPQSGSVLINGFNLYDENEKKYLEGVIGFVPQDDLLIEELSVYQNLWYNARMCLNNLPEDKISEIVDKTLTNLDLAETRDLVVGSPLNKIISGGQRKRVNIALELLREPTILFVDEPTSGLSSLDSEIVMSLLKEQTYKGKLVIVNIHQPCSDLYKMFDKIMIIDKGGYPIYYGNPTEAIVYFKTHSNHANPEEDQCVKCGNINTDQILQIIESKVVDEHGRATRIRKVSPREWADKYKANNTFSLQENDIEKKALPENYYSIPGLFKQSQLFFIRDLLSKLADKQYIFISLLGSPLLAFMLAHFIKFSKGSSYEFMENENIPAYMFVSVIMSLFFGLIISSEQIIKDRKILKRESFLNLSWFSYLNSKILLLFLISAIQTFLFTVIGNEILEIKGMTLSFWLVLFTASCSANILGLNISSAFNSVITIYMIIPIILIPQLLFSGVLVKFDKLNIGSSVSKEFVPVIGDLMPARWSFEAMAVEQFKNNEYDKKFFETNIERSRYDWYVNLIDKIRQDIINIVRVRDNIDYEADIDHKLFLANKYIDQMSFLADTFPGPWKTELIRSRIDTVNSKEAMKYLDFLRKHYSKLRNESMGKLDEIEKKLKDEMGENQLNVFKSSYRNSRLIQTVQGIGERRDIAAESGDKIIPKAEPGYTKAASKFGRAHFYAPYKQIGNWENIDTFWFDLTVMWLVSVLLYVALYFNLLRKLLTYVENLRFQKSEI